MRTPSWRRDPRRPTRLGRAMPLRLRARPRASGDAGRDAHRTHREARRWIERVDEHHERDDRRSSPAPAPCRCSPGRSRPRSGACRRSASGDDRAALADERRGGRVGRERVGEQEQQRTQEGRRQDRPADVPPERPRRCRRGSPTRRTTPGGGRRARAGRRSASAGSGSRCRRRPGRSGCRATTRPTRRSTWRMSLKKSVARPLNPNVARKAKASITPPNWARTPDAATTSCRSRPSGSPRTTAQASSPPMIAPGDGRAQGELDRADERARRNVSSREQPRRRCRA